MVTVIVVRVVEVVVDIMIDFDFLAARYDRVVMLVS